MDSKDIGFVLTAGGFAGLLSQLPGGALLDAIRSKRIAVALGAGMVAAGALIIAIWPSFPLVFCALVLQGITGGFLGLAIVAISLGLKRFPPDLNRRDSQRVRNERIWVH